MWKNGLLVEQPMCWTVAPKHLPKYCSYCLKPDLTTKLEKCAACKSIFYCNRSCQKADWPMHKVECKFCKAFSSAGDESYRLLLRIVKKLELGEDGTVAGNRKFSDLIDHKNELTEVYKMWRVGFDEYIGCIPNAVQISDDLVQSIICKIFINSFGLTSVFGQNIGIALCLQLSALDHSCKPTARIAFRGNECRMVPTQSNTTNVVLAHSYVDELLTRDERRKLLMDRYKFDCKCEGCMDEERNKDMVAFSCETCKRPIEIGAVCSNCKIKMSAERMALCKLVADLAESSINALSRCPTATDKFTLCSKSLEVVDDVLYSFNVRRLALLRAAYETCFSLEREEGGGEGEKWASENVRRSQMETYDKIEANLLREVAPPIGRIYGNDSAVYKELLLNLNALLKN
uniref:MYND-type domain-containing protein n=1 Tax=Ascaris lumbricoides TaxID=6252 RepID=A0A0M3HY83_ASCLU